MEMYGKKRRKKRVSNPSAIPAPISHASGFTFFAAPWKMALLASPVSSAWMTDAFNMPGAPLGYWKRCIERPETSILSRKLT